MIAHRWRNVDHVREARIVPADPLERVEPSDVRRQNNKGTAFARRPVAVGDKYGELTVVRLAGRRGLSGAHLWECVCRCGNLALRTTGALNAAVRAGSQPACLECRVQLAGGRKEARERALREAYRAQWVDYGTLWTAWQTKSLEDAVLLALVEEFGATEDRLAADDVTVDPCWPLGAGDVAFARRALLRRRGFDIPEPEDGDAPSVHDGGWVDSEIVKRVPLDTETLEAIRSLGGD